MVGTEEILRILTALHEDVVGGCHFDQNATISMISDRYWWRSMATDIRTYVRNCDACQRADTNNKPVSSIWHPIPVHGIFHRWWIDLVWPLKVTPTGNKYIVVATECLTRWTEVAPIPDKSAESVQNFLITIVYRFGVSTWPDFSPSSWQSEE